MGEASEASTSESEPSTDDEGSGDTLGSESERSADDDDYESDFVVADEETGSSSYDSGDDSVVELSESESACDRTVRKRTRVVVSSDESESE